MQDAIEFQREVSRFTSREAGYLVDMLRGVYKILDVADNLNDSTDSDAKLTLGDLISALDECDMIEIVDED